MKKALISGAGAIGRGFLPWKIPVDSFEIIFVDVNETIISDMRRRKRFKVYMVKEGQVVNMTVAVKDAFTPAIFQAEDHKDADVIFINVGPRNCVNAAKLVEEIDAPVVLCENDYHSVNLVKNSTRVKLPLFAIPDVISSNTAPPHLLAEDALSVTTEDGILYVDDRLGDIGIDCVLCDPSELEKQWTAKLYLHNTPHCIAAYLGALVGLTYIHEVIKVPALREIVQGSMQEMLQYLKLRWEIPHAFLDWYAYKEMARFASDQLFDPVSRVAREPIRKLELDGRLVGATQNCLSLGFIPENILTGIGCALLFNNSDDPDQHLHFMRDNLSTRDFNWYILGLRDGEALEMLLNDRIDTIIEKADSIKNELGMHGGGQ